MSRPPTDLPERLLTADATDFERRACDPAGSTVASKATAGAGASTLWPWVSLGVVGLVVGAVVGVRGWNA